MEYSVIAMYPEQIYGSPVNKREQPAGVQEQPAGVQERPAGVQERPAGVQERPAGVQRMLSKILDLSYKLCELFMNNKRISKASIDENIKIKAKD